MRNKWDIYSVKKEASKYKTRSEFQKGSSGAYKASIRLSIFEEACAHMPKRVDISGSNSSLFKWTNSLLIKEALKYKTRSEFQTSSRSAYMAATKRKLLDEICSHMTKYTRMGSQNPRFKWTDEDLTKEALKYSRRQELRENNYAAYLACKRRKILDHVCSHMKEFLYSYQESILLKEIRNIFPSAKKFRKMNIKIKKRPYIKGFEIDIFVPELRKGIEFDGTYWHSDVGLKKLRPNWPKNAIKNYHNIKDAYFRTIGVDILHIKEEDWIKDKEKCISLCLSFLRGTNG